MLAAILSILLNVSAAAQPPAVAVSTAAPALRLLSPDEYPDFHESFQSRSGLIKAARKALAYLEGPGVPRLVKLGDRTYGAGELADSLQELIQLAKTTTTQDEFAAAIKERFDVFESNGSDGAGRVVFSSYYQPLLAASRKRSAKYSIPSIAVRPT